MYGRLVEIEGVDPSKREEVLGIIRERVIPGLKEIDGFAALSRSSTRRTAVHGPWCSGRRRRARTTRNER
jgi:hypothetical protein